MCRTLLCASISCMWVQPGITQAQGEVTEYFERVCASKTLGDSNENIDAKLEPDNKLMGYQSQLKIISKKEKSIYTL